MLQDDPGLCDLLHPLRVEPAFGRPMVEEALFGPDFWAALKPYLGDEALPTEWILNHAPGVSELARDSSHFLGTLNLGLLSLVLARARLLDHEDPILQAHPALYGRATGRNRSGGEVAETVKHPVNQTSISHVTFMSVSCSAKVTKTSLWVS